MRTNNYYRHERPLGFLLEQPRMFKYAFNFPLSYYKDSKRFPQRKEINQIIGLAIQGKLKGMITYRPKLFLNYVFKTCEELERFDWDEEYAASYIMKLPLVNIPIVDFGLGLNLIMKTYKSFEALDIDDKDLITEIVARSILAKSQIKPERYDGDRAFTVYNKEAILKECINPEFNKFVQPPDITEQRNSGLPETATASFSAPKTAERSKPSPAQETQGAMVQPKIEVNFESEKVNIPWDLSAFKTLTKKAFALYCAYMIEAGLMPNFIAETDEVKRKKYIGHLLLRAGFGIDRKMTFDGEYRSIQKMFDAVHPFVKHQQSRLAEHTVLEQIIDILEPEAKVIATKELKLALNKHKKD